MSTFSLTPSDPLVDLVCTVNSSSGGNSVISVAVNDADKKFVVGAVIRECHGESKGGTNGWDISGTLADSHLSPVRTTY